MYSWYVVISVFMWFLFYLLLFFFIFRFVFCLLFWKLYRFSVLLLRELIYLQLGNFNILGKVIYGFFFEMYMFVMMFLFLIYLFIFSWRMSYSEFEACVENDGMSTCRVLPQFLQYIGDGADTVATSMSTTTSTVGPPVFTTVSFSSTPSPFPSSSNLPVLRTFVKKEGLGLVKKVAKSASDGLGDLSKKTLDSVIESEAFSNLFDFIVDFSPCRTRLRCPHPCGCDSGSDLLQFQTAGSGGCCNHWGFGWCGGCQERARYYFIFVLYIFVLYFLRCDWNVLFFIFSYLPFCSGRECCNWCSELPSPGWGFLLRWN